MHVLSGGHPWIFRSHLSTATNAFRDGKWLRLVDSGNRIVGYGIFAKEGLIGIRNLKRGSTPPSLPWLEKNLSLALERRKALRESTEAFRVLHGESDHFPGVVFDVYGSIGVLQTYHRSVDALGRWAATRLRRELGLSCVVWKFPSKRKEKSASDRTLYGTLPEKVTFREGSLTLTTEIGQGQKSGAFLDLRGLRRWLAAQSMPGARVLNLFSYTGTLGLAAEHAGAGEVWNVDISKGALEAARKYHTLKPGVSKFIEADVFDWVKTLSPEEKFDVIIVDPPMMAGQRDQVPVALRAYRRLYQAVSKNLTPQGKLIACCCTSRIDRKTFTETVSQTVSGRLKKELGVQTEPDHPVGYAEADYLKVFVYGPAR